MKKILSILLVAVLCLTLGVPALAAGSSVTFLGHEEGFAFTPGSVYSVSDLFENFKDVMPGDSRSEEITVVNEAKNNVKIKLYMRSLGAQEGTDEFLNQMNLTVTQRGDSILFDAPADQTAGLTEWTYLGTIYSGGEITLDVTLTVPAEMGNDFAHEIGYIDWQFMVEEFPVEPDDPAPDTGDDRQIGLYMGLMGLCGVILVVAIIGKKKKAK